MLRFPLSSVQIGAKKCIQNALKLLLPLSFWRFCCSFDTILIESKVLIRFGREIVRNKRLKLARKMFYRNILFWCKPRSTGPVPSKREQIQSQISHYRHMYEKVVFDRSRLKDTVISQHPIAVLDFG